MVDIEGKEKEMTLHDIIEKISMNSYTQYEIRVMLEELAASQKTKSIDLPKVVTIKRLAGHSISKEEAEEIANTHPVEKTAFFVEDGLLAIPEEHIFDNLTEPQ